MDWELKAIARQLFIQQSTVYRHLATIRKILEVHTCVEMLYAINKESVLSSSPLKLTPRGAEVFALIIQGLSNKRISEQLGMSYSGVRRHREKMLLCNNCESMLELIAKYRAQLTAEEGETRERDSEI